MSRLKLYQFPVSHYCEKVRWALDFKKAPYEIKNLAPVFHLPTMLALTRQTKVPALRLDGQLVHDSPRIIARLEERFPAAPSLYPTNAADRARALELEAFCDREIGPHVRRVAYFHILDDSGAVYELLSEGLPFPAQALLKVSLPAVTRTMRMAMRINEQGYESSLRKLNAALDRLEREIQPSGYLVGKKFSVADLAAASLLAPLVQPEQTLYARIQNTPSEFEKFCANYQARPFYDWVREIYRKHR